MTAKGQSMTRPQAVGLLHFHVSETDFAFILTRRTTIAFPIQGPSYTGARRLTQTPFLFPIHLGSPYETTSWPFYRPEHRITHESASLDRWKRYG